MKEQSDSTLESLELMDDFHHGASTHTLDTYEFLIDDFGVPSLLLHAIPIQYHELKFASLSLNVKKRTLTLNTPRTCCHFINLPGSLCTTMRLTRRCDFMIANPGSRGLPTVFVEQSVFIEH